MTDLAPLYQTAQAAPRVSPELRLLLMTVRQGLLMIVAGIEVYLGIARKR